MSTIDFGRHSTDYATHRPGFPSSFYDLVESHFDLSDLRVLDIATGPGVVALELAKRGANVVGIDIAPGQIEAARERARETGLVDRVTFEVARGESYEAPAQSFDLITAGQCWRWFDPDVTLPHFMKLLKPGGGLVIAHFDYIVQRSVIARRTEELILKHNPTWSLSSEKGLYPHYIDQVITQGFDFIKQVCYDHKQEFTHESWRGRIRTCNGVGSGGLPPAGVEQFDHELHELLKIDFPDEPLRIWHRVWAVLAKKPELDS
ncbi:MAG: class I SAM-dependent methyltransferase [Planctomycetota bacterium]|nr:class I SAM-dependent methyltransferase [Planctomycetota bacterium]